MTKNINKVNILCKYEKINKKLKKDLTIFFLILSM